jgi:hypothetical protein
VSTTLDIREHLVLLDADQPLHIATIKLQELIFSEMAEVYKNLTSRSQNSCEGAFYVAIRNFQSVSTDLSARVYLLDVLTSFSALNVAECGQGGVGLIGSVVRRLYTQCQSRHPELVEVFFYPGVDLPTTIEFPLGQKNGTELWTEGRRRRE